MAGALRALFFIWKGKIMGKYVFQKIFQLTGTLFVASVALFILLRASPIDPVELMLSGPGDDLAVETEIQNKKIEELREEFGLNKSYPEQYFSWLGSLLKGDFGKSIVTGHPVKDSIKLFLPQSILLALGASVIQVLLALGFGLLSVNYFGKLPDHLIRVLTIVARSVPSFAICLLLLSFFSVKVQWYAVNNSAEISRLWLPALAAASTSFPRLARIIRGALLDEMNKPYMLAYLAKGFPKRRLLIEGFRNAIVPILTSVTLTFAGSIGGMFITETIFSWPGIGKLGMTAILGQDYPVIQGYLLTVTFLVIVINGVTDMVYPLLDPTVRKEKIR